MSVVSVVLPPEANQKSMIHAATDSKGCENFFFFALVLITANLWLRMRDIKGWLTIPLHSHALLLRNSLDRNTLKRTLKNCDRIPEVQFFTVDGFLQGWRQGGGGTKFSLTYWPLGVSSYSREHMSNTNWTWYIYIVFLLSSIF